MADLRTGLASYCPETSESETIVFNSMAETRLPLDVHYATASSVAGPSAATRRDELEADFTTMEGSAPAGNIQHTSAQEPILEDEVATPRYIIAAALSLFAQRSNDANEEAEPPSLPFMLAIEPFAAADRMLGRAFGSDLLNSRHDGHPEESQQAAAMDAICMLQIVCDAFRLRRSHVLNALYILERASDCGIRLINANYRSLLLTALLVTIKECMESVVYAADLRSLFPSLDLRCLSHLEPLLLSTIDYRVSMLSGHVERERVASRLQRVRMTEKMLSSSSRVGFVFCRTLINWTRNYVDHIFQGTSPGVHAKHEQLVSL